MQLLKRQGGMKSGNGGENDQTSLYTYMKWPNQEKKFIKNKQKGE